MAATPTPPTDPEPDELPPLAPPPQPPPDPVPPTIDPNILAFAQALISGQATNNAALVQAQADAYAASMKVALKPENVDPPLMSDFNPKGDRDFPRPVLPWPVTQNGAEMPEYLLTVEELELLAQITPGHYRVTKSDDTQVIVSVVPEIDSASGATTKMNLVSKFGNKRNPDEKNNWPPLRVWLAELLGVPAPVRESARQPSGRIAGPQMGAPGQVAGVITGALTQNKQWLGPIAPHVDAMLANAGDAMEPARG